VNTENGCLSAKCVIEKGETRSANRILLKNQLESFRFEEQEGRNIILNRLLNWIGNSKIIFLSTLSIQTLIADSLCKRSV
jgi:hypothetical protein